MTAGDLFTRLTIWLALAGYAAGTVLLVRRSLRGARVLWTFGCLCYLAHVTCAFGFFHHWSHRAAYEETARQTRELIGWDWGGGLFINHLFTLVWLTDVLWWWLAPARHAARSRTKSALLHGFLFFMVCQGAVVFGHGPVRWYGVLICSVVAAFWWRRLVAAKDVEAPRGS